MKIEFAPIGIIRSPHSGLIAVVDIRRPWRTHLKCHHEFLRLSIVVRRLPNTITGIAGEIRAVVDPLIGIDDDGGDARGVVAPHDVLDIEEGAISILTVRRLENFL